MDNGKLFEDGVKQGGKGNQDAGTCKPEASGSANI